MKTTIVIAAVATLIGGIAVGACSSTLDDESNDDVGVRNTVLGPVLTDTRDYTLYILGGDAPCGKACLAAWPAVGTDGLLTVDKDVSAKVAVNADGQVTVNGMKVYTYVQDKEPGDVNGQGVKDAWGVWWALDSQGEVIKNDGSSPVSPGGGSYGY